jgi:cell division protein FtsZ
VVATGMDGASMAAIEPKLEHVQAFEAPLEIELTPASAPARFEPEPIMAVAAAPVEIRPGQAGFTFEEPAVVRLQAAARAAETDDEPLFPTPRYAEDRRQKGGWLSLFGGRRPDAHAAPGRTMVQAQPQHEVYEDEEEAVDEDLEIPSFLRRLAN